LALGLSSEELDKKMGLKNKTPRTRSIESRSKERCLSPKLFYSFARALEVSDKDMKQFLFERAKPLDGGVAEAIRNARHDKRISCAFVAEKVGVSRQHIS